MADKKSLSEYRYRISMRYLNNKKHVTTPIKNECLKSLIIDHNYDVNCMPILYANLNLDRSLVDDMINNQNDNLMIVALSKYDNCTDLKLEVECFRKKFIYFLPDDVNKMDHVDYNETTESQMKGDTYRSITLGLICLDHVNNNKVACELTAKGITNYDAVKYFTAHIDDMIIEPFLYNDTFDQLVVTPQDSVNKAIAFLNNYRVFYSTPYRYYNDFNYTYLLSSSGKATKRRDETYSSVIINIRDIDDAAANDTGVIINKTTGTYEVYVSYASTEVYDNSIVNKSKNKLRGITSSGSSDRTLLNQASYSNQKIHSVRLNNDNTNMIDNLEAQSNMDNFLVYFSKNDLDTELFTINKRISIHNIERYQDYNGDYLLYRKRELFLREDDTFLLSSMINLKRIER